MKAIAMIAGAIALATAGPIGAEENAHWSYSGAEGPNNWGKLTQAFDTCGSGQNQSPIDLTGAVDGESPALVFDYSQVGVEEINTGHAIQEKVLAGNFVTILDQRYELKQFHFHSPSEHTIQGQYFPMEVHLVHQDEQGDYLVVGLLFEEGETNHLINQLPSFRNKRGEAPYANPVDYNELIPGRQDYFRYKGSLTTPPCTEGVRWVVFKQPLIAAPEQIQHYHDLLGFDNNRPLQPIHSRVIVE